MRGENNSQDHETMEEILSSIRQLMEEEAVQKKCSISEEEDILALTDIVPDENSSSLGTEKKRTLSKEKKEPRLPSWAENIKTPLPPQASQVHKTQDQEKVLLSQPTVHKTAQAFQDLSQTAKASREALENTSIPSPLESPLRELLKPLLKEWLDTNLPVLVRWIVNEQIEKLLREEATIRQPTGKREK